jgi:iron complex outermembrane receptor protein
MAPRHRETGPLKPTTRPNARLTLLAATALIGAPQAHAQTAPATAPKPSAQIETISVTARRRTETAQKVPISITVISGARAAQENLNNLQDILAEVPTADFRTSSSNKDRTLFIRGIGTISTSPGVEPSVSTVVDGVVLARSGQATLDLVDLAQVEVLSGPQGTLFGKNASAGVVNITTAKPKPDFHAWAEADYFGSSGNEYRVTGGVTGTIAPNLTASIAALGDGFDGNVHNIFDNKEVNGYQRDGFRSKFLYQPSDDLDITLGVDYLKSLDTVPNGVFISPNRTAYPTDITTPNPTLAKLLRAEGIAPTLNNTTIDNNVTSSADDDNGGLGLTINKKLGDMTLTSITAWRIWNNVQIQDYDETAPSPKGFVQIKDRGNLLFNQVSQEIRLASPKGGFIDYQIGLYYLGGFDEESYDRNLSKAATPTIVSTRGAADFGTNTTDVAVFGEGNLNFTDNFRGIFGFRLVHDDIDYTFGRISSSPVTVTGIKPDFHSEGSNSVLSYTDRVGLQYDITKDINAYFTYARGYKGPAYNVFFNMAATDTGALKPETSDDFEVGLKGNALSDRLQVHIAAYKQSFNDYQANFAQEVAGAIVTRLINAGAVSTRGVEGGLTARPIPDLDLTTNAAYVDARVDEFACPPNAATTCNINGQPLPFAPRWKLDATARYTIPINDVYDASVATDFDWQSKQQYQLTETPDTVQQAYGIWNASVTLRNFSQDWRVTGLVKNILDQHYSDYIAYGSLAGAIRYVPRDNSRYFGIEVRKDF